MRRAARWGTFAAGLLLGAGVRAQEIGERTVPAAESVADGTDARHPGGASMAERTAAHEAIVATSASRPSAYVEKAPPRPIAERSGDGAPSAAALWVQGYWDWDSARKEFVWVTGTWRAPRPGKFWVDGFWRHVDGKGWERVAGFWSAARDPSPVGSSVRVVRDWQKLGPPPTRPPEAVAGAPAPDFFYIAGEYIPDGEAVMWRPGFWYHTQPGWEWNPAHWVRQGAGWEFRHGSWSRVGGVPAPPPRNDARFRPPTLVSTPAGAPPEGNTAPPNRLVPTSLDTRSGTTVPDPTASAPGVEGTAEPADGAMDRQAANPAATAGENAAGAGTAARPPGSPPSAAQPGYYYPGGYYPGAGNPWNYGGWGARSSAAGFIGQFLPF